MKSSLFLLRLLVVSIVLTFVSFLHADEIRPKHVFIISIDQGNPDALQEFKMPVLQQMAREGARSWSAYTIVPSITLPSHTSMLTGVGIQKHQVLWNDFDSKHPPLGVPTIFSLAKKMGLVTAMFVGKQKFQYLNLPGSIDTFVWPEPDNNALKVAGAFAKEVGTLKPNLCFIHFRDPDTAGHSHGTRSPEKIAALEEVDAALGIIREAIAKAGLADSSVIIITADHGGHDVKDNEGKVIGGAHGTAEAADVTIPWIAYGTGVRKGYDITAPIVQYDTAATALWLLGIPIPEHFWGHPVTSAFDLSEKPKS